jgi:hypothetical protein
VNDCSLEIWIPRGSCFAGMVGWAELLEPWATAAAPLEETGASTGATSRGMGPSTHARNAEITSGRAISQQGLATTCKDPAARGTGAEGRVLVWRMSLEERGRRGNALRGGIRCHPLRGNTSRGQRGSRRLVDIPCGLGEGLRAHKFGGRGDVERWGKPVVQGVYASQRLSFGAAGKARSQTVAKVANRTWEIRLSGMKTGARGNVAHGEPRNPTRNRKSGIGHSSPIGARASNLSKHSLPVKANDPPEASLAGARQRTSRSVGRRC